LLAEGILTHDLLAYLLHVVRFGQHYHLWNLTG
jgi:hypothetical protein